jgi:hypothetical protein
MSFPASARRWHQTAAVWLLLLAALFGAYSASAVRSGGIASQPFRRTA